jgi:hypothetical protein
LAGGGYVHEVLTFLPQECQLRPGLMLLEDRTLLRTHFSSSVTHLVSPGLSSIKNLSSRTGVWSWRAVCREMENPVTVVATSARTHIYFMTVVDKEWQ